MKKTNMYIRAGLAVVFGTMFVIGSVLMATDMLEYKKDRDVYDNAASVYQAEPVETDPVETDADIEPDVADAVPISVDFDMLLADAPDVQGWLYCPGTSINYPVVQGRDNDQYLRHDYLGNYATAGSIFIEAANAPGFQDSNTVIYGHHMKDGSMFAGLSDWADQDFYDAHKEMWLLTPDQDYRIELFSGYITPATSDTYAVYQGPSDDFEAYLDKMLGQSDFDAGDDLALSRDSRCVVLSTCDYTYQDARYVLHGVLVPVDRGNQKSN